MATSKASEQPDKRPGKPKRKKEDLRPKDERWWLLTDEADRERMAGIAWSTAWREFEREGRDRRENARDSDELYEGQANDQTVEAPSYNLVRACVDTLVAHTIKNKIRPLFVTEEGEYDDRTKADMMQKAVDGDFERAGLWGELGRQFCYDGNKYDAGMILFSPDYTNKRILIERMFSWEFFVPAREARRGKPSQGFRLVDIDRSVLLDRLGTDIKDELRQAVLDAPNAPMEWFDLNEIEDDTVSDRVLVGEFWHLPSGQVDKQKKEEWELKTATHDGLHVWVLGGTTEKDSTDATLLKAEAWPFEFFPIMEYKPRKRSRSYWSRSVPETVVSAQIAVNRMNKRIDGVMDLHAVPKTYLWDKAGINTDKLTNDPANIITGRVPAGQAISWHTPASISGDYINRVDKLIAWAEKELGLPEFAIAPNKPKGIEHAPALQFLSEEQSVRHTASFQAWEEAFCQGVRIYIEMARLMAKVHKDFSVTWGDSEDLKHFRWADVDLDDMRFKLKLPPTNYFSQNPAAKMQQIISLAQAAPGAVNPQQIALFMAEQHMDIKALLGDTTSAEKVIEKRINAVVKDGYNEKNAPDAWMNLELAFMTGVAKVNYYEAHGLEESKLDELRNWVEDVKARLDKKRQDDAIAAAAAQGMVAPPGAPVGPEAPLAPMAPGGNGAPPPMPMEEGGPAGPMQ